MKISYPIDEGNKIGLRNAQLGAIHALSAFDTVNKKDAAIIVMPTGSGKTTVLMLAPFLLRKHRVLVVTPSKMVRGQIAEDFSELSTLCKTNVFNEKMNKPCIYELEHLFDERQIDYLEKADVIVATPSCALSLSETEWAKNNIDLVEIDEAHHTPAKTWSQILINLKVASHILFTATPFRLDRKELSGEIVFDYPLSMAYQDGIFGEIQYISVEQSEDNDLSIAKCTESIFYTDKEAGYEHYIMVRTDTKKNAEMLERLYADNTSLKLIRIDSSVTNSKIKTILRQLRAGNLDGIICVDMLGEGYDFPNLKIAAIHAPHKSLASTLQFIGRFARTNASNIGTAKFVAVDDENLEIENNLLYSKDAVWQDMIIGMSEGKNRQEKENRNYYKEYVSDEVSIFSNVPVQAIRPNCHVKIFRVSNFNINGQFPDFCNVANRVFRNRMANTIVGIGLDYTSPLWIGNGEKINTEYILYIIHYQKQTKMLHIYSQRHSEVIYNELVEAFCDSYEAIPKSEIYRVLGGLKNFEIFNSGMLNKQAESGESYRIMAGSDVSDAIDKDSGKMYSAGHAFCKAMDKTEEITIGYSSASKVWSSSYKDLKEYIFWCDEVGKKIDNNNIVVKTNTNFDYLPLPETLKEYPDNIFYAEFSAATYNCPPLIKYENAKRKDIRLTDAEIIIKRVLLDRVILEISIDEHSEEVECDLSARYKSKENVFKIYVGGIEMGLDSFLTEQPLIFRTLSDATITGTEIIASEYDGDVFDVSVIEEIDWKKHNTDIALEVRETDTDTRVSIQDTLMEILSEKDEYRYIIYDHGSGEIADYIAIKENDTELNIELYHVKRMNGAIHNNSVSDVYEVSGQAIKSTIWLKSKGVLIEKISNRHKSGHCIVKKGGSFENMIKALKSSDKLMRGCICIVQPGISKGLPMPDKIQEVLAATDKHVKRAGKVTAFRILGSY